MTLKKNSLIISNGDGMDLLQKECIASVTLYDVRASEGESTLKYHPLTFDVLT